FAFAQFRISRQSLSRTCRTTFYRVVATCVLRWRPYSDFHSQNKLQLNCNKSQRPPGEAALLQCTTQSLPAADLRNSRRRPACYEFRRCRVSVAALADKRESLPDFCPA